MPEDSGKTPSECVKTANAFKHFIKILIRIIQNRLRLDFVMTNLYSIELFRADLNSRRGWSVLLPVGPPPPLSRYPTSRADNSTELDRIQSWYFQSTSQKRPISYISSRTACLRTPRIGNFRKTSTYVPPLT